VVKDRGWCSIKRTVGSIVHQLPAPPAKKQKVDISRHLQTPQQPPITKTSAKKNTKNQKKVKKKNIHQPDSGGGSEDIFE